MAKVLVADDDADHQRLLAEIVRQLGHDVTVADDGWAALVAAAHHRPALVVANVDMPEMDGLQLCRALREDPVLAETPVVLVTALLLPDDPLLSGSGAVAVVRKPFDVRELSALIATWLGDQAPPPGGRDPAAVPATIPAAIDPAFADAMLRSVDAGLAACDNCGRLTSFNGFLRDFFGDDSVAVPLKEWAQRFGLRHPDGTPLQTSELPMIRALHGEIVDHAGQLAVDRHGRQRWLTINARPVSAGDGTVIGAVAAVHDVTAEYRARVYQVCKGEVLKALAESPSAAAAGDHAVRVLATALGWPHVRLWLLDPVVDRLRPAATYTAPHEQDPVMPASLARGQGLAGACWQGGETLWIADIRAPDSPVLPEVAATANYRTAGAVPVRIGDRLIGALTFFAHDQQESEPSLMLLLTGIADSIAAHREQQRADELARHLTATVDEYMALVGHELRTPLTSITAYVQFIAESPDLPEDVRDLIEVIDRNSRRLRQLIEQLLDLAALEAGHCPLAVAEVDLAAVVTAAVTNAKIAAFDSGIRIETRLPGPLTVSGDAGRLAQMMQGLLDNALKFSHDNSTVSVAVTSDDETVVLAITDTGIGLPGDAPAHLFRRLYRGDNARHRGIPGNGLGLALCRSVVERHHGCITLSPHQPAGTTVTVRLPRRRP